MGRKALTEATAETVEVRKERKRSLSYRLKIPAEMVPEEAKSRKLSMSFYKRRVTIRPAKYGGFGFTFGGRLAYASVVQHADLPTGRVAIRWDGFDG
jgi:hypothetical protein